MRVGSFASGRCGASLGAPSHSTNSRPFDKHHGSVVAPSAIAIDTTVRRIVIIVITVVTIIRAAHAGLWPAQGPARSREHRTDSDHRDTVTRFSAKDDEQPEECANDTKNDQDPARYRFDRVSSFFYDRINYCPRTSILILTIKV
jgi:hypothetical protein